MGSKLVIFLTVKINSYSFIKLNYGDDILKLKEKAILIQCFPIAKNICQLGIFFRLNHFFFCLYVLPKITKVCSHFVDIYRATKLNLKRLVEMLCTYLVQYPLDHLVSSCERQIVEA